MRQVNSKHVKSGDEVPSIAKIVKDVPYKVG